MSVTRHKVGVSTNTGSVEAWVFDLPGCHAGGATTEEVREILPVVISEHLSWLARHGETVHSGPDGAFVVNGLAAGLYTVTVEGYPHQSVSQVHVSEGRGGDVDVVVIESVGVAGVVRDSDGVRLAGAAVSAEGAAALALGAQGVWMGSVWLTTEEAETHPVVKEKFLKATSRDTIRSRSLTGKPARQLRSAWTDAWEDPSNPDPLPMPLQPRLVREARARIDRTAHKSEGAAQLANYFVGQIVGSMNQVTSVRHVIEELVQEYADTMERLDSWAEG